jgi:hypothetical protein
MNVDPFSGSLTPCVLNFFLQHAQIELATMSDSFWDIVSHPLLTLQK